MFMPPKARITKDMVIEAGLKIVRTEGVEALNVRRIAAELECSTQPVMYHYKTVGELKADVYAAADAVHTERLMRDVQNSDNPMLTIGLNYIGFAAEEKHLFRFLFQSGKFRNTSFGDMMNGEEIGFLLAPLKAAAGLDEKQAREGFGAIFACVHGIASLIANNSIGYDKEGFTRLLTVTFMGAVGYIKGEKL